MLEKLLINLKLEREVNPLGRISLSVYGNNLYKDKTVLITGGTGSWGHVLTKRLLSENVKEIRILSRNELSQVTMERLFNSKKLKFIIGDVRDFNAVNFAMKNVDYVFHLAALKHVPVCEMQPKEAILTNITGTENIVKAAIANDVLKVIDVSSDKAVSPHNLYGMTKAVGEKLTINGNSLTDKTKFVCIRAGNVMGSNGSVIPFFINQIKNYNMITITNSEMTRYFITLDEAINLLIKAAEISFGGETLVMNMPSCKIIELANVLIKNYGNENTVIKEIGSRPGEKLHEELISAHESKNTYLLSENYYLIAPSINLEALNNYYDNFKNYKKVDFETFNSSQRLMPNNELEEKLKSGKFI